MIRMFGRLGSVAEEETGVSGLVNNWQAVRSRAVRNNRESLILPMATPLCGGARTNE
jgi:hypothetical protein